MRRNWHKVTLGEICSFKYGEMPKKNDLAPDGYPVFSGYRIVGHSTRYHYRDPEIIVVARGVGGTGDIKMSPPFCFLTNLSIAVVVKAANVDKSFLFYRLASTTLWSLRTGSAQAQITIERLRVFEVEMPPLDIQRQIASILSAYDDLIEVNARRIAILEEMARRLFDEWFVKFRFPGHEATPFVDTTIGSLPKGWREAVLGNVVDVNNDTLAPRTAPDTIHYIDISSVSPGTVNEVRTLRFSDAPGRARRRVRKGDVIWSMVRPNLRSYALVLRLKPDTIASTGFAVLRAKAIPWSYLYLAATTDQFVAYLEGRARGSAYPAVSASDFESATLQLPPPELLDKFHEHAGPMLELAAVLRDQADYLRAARDLLLPKLISGEITLASAERGIEAIVKRAAAE